MHPGFRRVSVSAWMITAGCAALSSLPAAGEELRTTPNELRLIWVDLCDVGPATVEGVTRELQVLLDPFSIHLAADTSAPGTDGEAGGVRIVLMRSNPNRTRRGAPAGGAVRLEPGRQLTAWIFPAEIAGALGLAFERHPLWDVPSRQRLQRALAVVVAHELAHSLAGAGHSKAGLMVPQMRPRQMLDPGLAFDGDIGPAFLAGVARLGAAVPLADAATDASLTHVAASLH